MKDAKDVLEVEGVNNMNDKLICPVKRLNESNIDLQVDMNDDNMNINIDILAVNSCHAFNSFMNC